MNRTLPDTCLITGSFDDLDDFTQRLQQTLDEAPKLVQLRCKGLDASATIALAARAAAICSERGVLLLVATSPDIFAHCAGDGLHLSSGALRGVEVRPVGDDRLLSVSCHTAEELAQAVGLGADILLLSPIKATAAHPDLAGIGWERFGEMTGELSIPVYGLGGMQPEDLAAAQAAGAQGVALTRPFWG